MRKEKSVLLEALQTAGRIISKNFNKKKKITYKGDIDIVTETDKKAESAVIGVIEKNFPNDAILAEESGFKRKAKRRWIIDPIDGTTNFFHSFPHVAVSIAYEEDEEILLGGVFDPVKNELFFAQKGKGAKLNGKKICVSETKKLSSSLLATGFPYDRKKYPDEYLKLFKLFMKTSMGIRRCGVASLDLCYVACGRIDGFWELKLKPWDTAAGILIVTESGGRVTNFKGKKFNIFMPEIVAANKNISREMTRLLKPNLQDLNCFS